jgi:hypothetical protein
MDGTGTSQARDNAPNPLPISPTLAEAIAALVNATTLLAQNQNAIRVVGVEITEERPLMWILLIPVHRCSQKLMSH